jgi:DNA-binding MarR family transcriptional regulator
MQTQTTDTVYRFIVEYMNAHDGLAPSQREIADGCYIARSAVVRHLDKLEAWGRIIHEPNKARSIRLPRESIQP